MVRSMTSSKNIPDGDLSLSIEALKRKVLDAAVRGELTEQLAEDGTAKDLLMQISDEKRRLIAEGKIKKEKALPAISDEEIPFEIPENWEWVRLGDLGLFRKGPFGSSLTKSMFIPKSETAIKVYEQKNAIQKNAAIGDYYISREYFDTNMRGFEIKAGDIIVSCAGTVGETYVLPQNMEQGIINQALMRIRLFPSINLDYFLLYFDYVLKGTAQSNSKGTAIVNIPPFEVFKKFLVPFPPLAEQHRIVKRIDDAFHQLDELKKLQDAYSSNLDALRKKVIEEGIKGNLTERQAEDGTAAELLKEIEAEKQELIKAGKIKKEKPLPEITEEEKPFEIPENWVWVRLSDLVVKNIKRGKAPKYSDTGNTLVFAQKCNLKAGGINLNLAYHLNEDILSRYPEDEFLQDGDIIINCTGTGTLGRIGIFHESDRIDMMKIVPDSHITTVRSSNKISSQYLYYYLKSIQKTIEEVGEGSTNQKELKPLSIMSLMIPLPPLAEQRRIVKRIDDVLMLLEKNSYS